MIKLDVCQEWKESQNIKKSILAQKENHMILLVHTKNKF